MNLVKLVTVGAALLTMTVAPLAMASGPSGALRVSELGAVTVHEAPALQAGGRGIATVRYATPTRVMQKRLYINAKESGAEILSVRQVGGKGDTMTKRGNIVTPGGELRVLKANGSVARSLKNP